VRGWRKCSEMHKDPECSPVNGSGTGPYAFQHRSLRAKDPVVWVPDNSLRFGSDQMSRIRQWKSNMRVRKMSARLNGEG